MSSVPPLAREALELARRGDTAGAVEAARKAVAAHPDDYGLRLFIGLLHSRRMELGEALSHVRKAVSLAPKDPLPRIELVRLLIGLGRLDDAEQELARVDAPGLEPLRLQAMLLVQQDRPGQAAKLLQQVVGADPGDHESWGNLGSALLAVGQPRRAVDAFARASQLRPDIAKFHDKLMQAQVDSGQGEQALETARELANGNPTVAEPWLTVARLQDLLERPDEAVETLRTALAAEPDHVPALIGLAGLLERQNRIDELSEIIARIDRLGPATPELPLLRARLAFRRGDLDRALEVAEATPATFDRGARAELIGRVQDRLGNSAAAFAAFEAMNRESDLSPQVVARRSQALRELIDARARITTIEWVQSWSAEGDTPPARQPTFLIGFPRSGTTLLDTFLMGHPDLGVAEEGPMVQAVAARLGDYERIASLDAAELRSLRSCYFEAAARYVSKLGDRLLIDKFPLGAIEAGLIHRLFPTAKIIFALRHPCDVVLSCFMTRFQPTRTLISFSTLEDAARLYDKVMGFWSQCRAAMSLDVHDIRYEELVADPERTLRQLAAFLNLEWDDRLLQHEESAGKRSFIGTGSYAQVVEPLYDRSIGRWKRYREQLAPVLPLLEPWALKFGYET